MPTRPRERRTNRSATSVALLWLLASGAIAPARAQTGSGIADTRHNLSVSGPGPVRALTETRICIFCHTPHNATPLSPLWNKELEPQVYTVYASPTLRAGPLPQPSGPTKLCLSCHDGTIAIGAVVNPAGGIRVGGMPGPLSNFGLDLSGHHPVSFPYHTALPNAELAPSPPADLTFGGGDEMHCTTCHDPHNDTYGKFLVKDNRYSALCVECHQLNGWQSSAHATSAASVVGILPRPPKTWPRYTRLNEWGCEACHTPHFAPTAEDLLNFTDVPPAFSCTTPGCHTSGAGTVHSASVATAQARARMPGRAIGTGVNIARQTQKISAHHLTPGLSPMAARLRRRASRSGIRSVGCPDCHNPHLTAIRQAKAPYASGMLEGASGVDRNGMWVDSARYEYEVCFKCHADDTPDINYIPRVRTVTNTRAAFDPTNPSYHPVIAIGRNMNVPSIPSAFEPDMKPSELMYCSSCHADDEGDSRGPHGSSFAPILRDRYETADNTSESFDVYALCYRCHDRSSILRDASFRKTGNGGGHSGHLGPTVKAPCSACHDPHGVNVTWAVGPSGTGSHTHLINFDTRIVSANTKKYPTFCDPRDVSSSGECRESRGKGCDVCCHDVRHSLGTDACGAPVALGRPAARARAAMAVGGPRKGQVVSAPGCSPGSRVVCGLYP